MKIGNVEEAQAMLELKDQEIQHLKEMIEAIMPLFLNAIDNLNDMPISDRWANNWAGDAYQLCEKYDYFRLDGKKVSVDNDDIETALVVGEIIKAPFMDISLDVIVDGRVITRLNSYLVEKQGLNAQDINAIKETHVERYHLFNEMKQTDDPAKLKLLAKDFEELEYHQQDLWKFGRNSDFHRWFEVPKCICPHMDNQDYLGTGIRVYEKDCPVHEDKFAELFKPVPEICEAMKNADK